MHIETTWHRAMTETLRREGARGPWLALVSQVLHLAGPGAQFERHFERPWSSSTFSGSRHTIRLAFEGPEPVEQGEAFIAALPEHEFSLSGQLVADATITKVEHSLVDGPRMELEAELLVLDEA